jgi:hypothetical protein
MPRLRRGAKPEVFAVTAARPSLSDDIRAREKRYALAMGIRTLCFIATVATQGVVRWVMFTLALVLPYFAVVMANAGRESGQSGPAPVILPLRTELPPLRREDPSGNS